MWLECLESRDGAKRFFERFMEEVVAGDPQLGGMTPAKVLDFQANATGREGRYYIGQRVRHWINAMKLTAKSKDTYFSIISGFFKHRKAPLPPDPSFRWRNSVEPVEAYLPVEDLRLIVANSNKMYKAVFLMKAQALLDNKGLVHISNNCAEQVVKAVTNNAGIFRIPLPPRKTNPNPFFTLLSSRSDFADAFRAYMKSTTNDIFSRLFWNQAGKPLTEFNIQHYFWRRAVETGVITPKTPKCPRCDARTLRRRRKYDKVRKRCYVCPKCGYVMFACEMGDEWKRKCCRNRYRARPHETRDLMSSRWGQSGADRFVRETIMGHNTGKLDPDRYEKVKYQPDLAEAEYRKALPWLNIMSEDPTKVDRGAIDVELESYKEEMKLLRGELTVLRKRQKMLDDPRLTEALEWAIKEMEKKQK